MNQRQIHIKHAQCKLIISKTIETTTGIDVFVNKVHIKMFFLPIYHFQSTHLTLIWLHISVNLNNTMNWNWIELGALESIDSDDQIKCGIDWLIRQNCYLSIYWPLSLVSCEKIIWKNCKSKFKFNRDIDLVYNLEIVNSKSTS